MFAASTFGGMTREKKKVNGALPPRLRRISQSVGRIPHRRDELVPKPKGSAIVKEGTPQLLTSTAEANFPRPATAGESARANPAVTPMHSPGSKRNEGIGR